MTVFGPVVILHDGKALWFESMRGGVGMLQVEVHGKLGFWPFFFKVLAKQRVPTPLDGLAPRDRSPDLLGARVSKGLLRL